MSNRYLGGFISASNNPLLQLGAPTIGTATAGNAQASVTFTAPATGTPTSYLFAPVAMPADGKIYSWDEAQQNWVEVSTI